MRIMTPEKPTNITHPDAEFVQLLGGLSGVFSGIQAQYAQCAEEKEQYRQQVSALQTVPSNIVAANKQKKLIAILNAIFACEYIDGVSKKEFMQRMANALGCPGIADYNKALYNVKNTYGYDDIFTELSDAAHRELTKND